MTYVYTYPQFAIPKELQDWLILWFNWQHNWTTVVDISWNKRDAVAGGWTVLARLHWANYMQFDWVDDYVKTTYSVVNNVSDITVVMFMNSADITTYALWYISEWYWNPSWTKLLEIRNANNSAGKLTTVVRITHDIFIDIDFQITSNKWYMIAISFDATNNVLNAYTNWVQVYTQSWFAAATYTNATTWLELWRLNNTNTYAANTKLWATLFYNKVLQAKHISKMYDRFRQRYHD